MPLLLPLPDEALIANEIPQTTTIDRARGKFTPEIGGSPDMAAHLRHAAHLRLQLVVAHHHGHADRIGCRPERSVVHLGLSAGSVGRRRVGAAMAGSSSVCWGYCPAPYWGAMPFYPSYAHYAAYGGAYWDPHGSAAAWGPDGWAATSGNVYHQMGSHGRRHAYLRRIRRLDRKCGVQ